jgi:hypothetical protein
VIENLPPSTEAWTGGHIRRGQAPATSRGSGSTPYSTTSALQHIYGSANFTITNVKERAQSKKRMDGRRPLSTTTQLLLRPPPPAPTLPSHNYPVRSMGSASTATAPPPMLPHTPDLPATQQLLPATQFTSFIRLRAGIYLRLRLHTSPASPQATVALHPLQLVPVADSTLRHTATG